MIIHKLEMYNFRQYIDLQEVSFSTDPERNVTVLIGVNTVSYTHLRNLFRINCQNTMMVLLCLYLMIRQMRKSTDR